MQGKPSIRSGYHPVAAKGSPEGLPKGKDEPLPLCRQHQNQVSMDHDDILAVQAQKSE